MSSGYTEGPSLDTDCNKSPSPDTDIVSVPTIDSLGYGHWTSPMLLAVALNIFELYTIKLST